MIKTSSVELEYKSHQWSESQSISHDGTKYELLQKLIWVIVLSYRDLYSRDLLDLYLSRALNVPLKDGRLAPVDEKHYVLTLDYTLKMLNIHERYQCGIPVIIEGETGVGKTALIEMLSLLWNHSWIAQWEHSKEIVVELMKRKLGGQSYIELSFF